MWAQQGNLHCPLDRLGLLCDDISWTYLCDSYFPQCFFYFSLFSRFSSSALYINLLLGYFTLFLACTNDLDDVVFLLMFSYSFTFLYGLQNCGKSCEERHQQRKGSNSFIFYFYLCFFFSHIEDNVLFKHGREKLGYFVVDPICWKVCLVWNCC